MAKVHNANFNIVCSIDERNASIIIDAKGCVTILKPDKPVKYKITTLKKK